MVFLPRFFARGGEVLDPREDIFSALLKGTGDSYSRSRRKREAVPWRATWVARDRRGRRIFAPDNPFHHALDLWCGGGAAQKKIALFASGLSSSLPRLYPPPSPDHLSL